MKNQQQKKQDTRVPIPLNLQETQELEKLAKGEFRSKQAMAGIIYRLGMKAYRNSGATEGQGQ